MQVQHPGVLLPVHDGSLSEMRFRDSPPPVRLRESTELSGPVSGYVSVSFLARSKLSSYF
jgi:hypothetical protein